MYTADENLNDIRGAAAYRNVWKVIAHSWAGAAPVNERLTRIRPDLHRRQDDALLDPLAGYLA